VLDPTAGRDGIRRAVELHGGRFGVRVLELLACCLPAVTSVLTRASVTFSWQEDYAKVLPRVELEWAPRPCRFEKGGEITHRTEAAAIRAHGRRGPALCLEDLRVG
jgi:hypothetical protein